jgi:hypothetical protein
MSLEKILYLDRVDILSSRDNGVFPPVHEPDETVFILPGHVARRKSFARTSRMAISNVPGT